MIGSVTRVSAMTNIYSPPINSQAPPEKADATVEEEPEISNLARQLSSAAERAAQRDASLDYKQLLDLAQKTNPASLYALLYRTSSSKTPAVRTDTADTDLLARDAQAIEFVKTYYSNWKIGQKAENPFSDLSSEQLIVIAYDQGRDFTLSERVSAYEEWERRDSDWKNNNVLMGMIEYDSTGKLSKYHKSLYEHYKSSPPIIQAEWGGDEKEMFLLLLMAKDALSSGIKKKDDKDEDDPLLFLLEILAESTEELLNRLKKEQELEAL